MDATVHSTRWARFWTRRDRIPLLLQAILTLIRGPVRGPDVHGQWRAGRTVDRALSDVAALQSRALQSRVLADLANTGKCPTYRLADAAPWSSSIGRVAVGEYHAGHGSIPLNRMATSDWRLGNARLMRVYRDGPRPCLSRLGSAVFPPDICRDDDRQISPGVRPAA